MLTLSNMLMGSRRHYGSQSLSPNSRVFVSEQWAFVSGVTGLKDNFGIFEPGPYFPRYVCVFD